MITEAQKQAIRDRHPVDRVAGETVTLRRQREGARGAQYVGPCPVCSEDPHSRTAARFECCSDKWLCAVCQDGGDVIALVMKRDGVDFRTAIERLGGAGAVEITPEMARREGRRGYLGGLTHPPADYAPVLAAAWREGWQKQQRAASYAEFARDRERRRLLGFCAQAVPWGSSPDLIEYFHRRGLAEPPPGARLGWHPAMPYFADGREQEPLLIHKGPAMLAPIIGAAGGFAGLHITWLDLRESKGKARIFHPETGEALPAKKVRGSKAGGFIDLGGDPAARRMVAGEGIETVIAAYTDMVRAGRMSVPTLFRSGIDLGNLAGRATGTVAHTTIKTASGRAQRVPGPLPDCTSPAMPVPDAIDTLVLLGDGDSDPVLTRLAMERAAARHAREGRAVAVAWPQGKQETGQGAE